MTEFKRYRRKNISEMRDLNDDEKKYPDSLLTSGISVSDEDKRIPLGEFIMGKIARNPNNHKDQWYVNPTYFEENFEHDN